MSIAIELMEQIKKTALENNLNHIDEVEIEVGQLKLIIPEVMKNAFEVVSKETVAEGALLKIDEVKAWVKCRKCQNEYEPQIDNFLCTVCNQADVDIISGNQIILKSLVCYSQER